MNDRGQKIYFNYDAAKKLLAIEAFKNLKKISLGKKNARWT